MKLLGIIEENMVGRTTVRMSRRTVCLDGALGRVQAQDVGKMVYDNEGVIQVESQEQKYRRERHRPLRVVERPVAAQHDIGDAVAGVEQKLLERLAKKGVQTFASKHEILGILEEELYEYKMAVHQKHGTTDLQDELRDIAVAAIFGIVSLK